MTDGYTFYTCTTGSLSASSTRYLTIPYIGIPVSIGETRLKSAGNIAKKIWVIVTENTFEGTAVITLLKNGAPTALQVQNAFGVGWYSTTADVPIADGDELSIRVYLPALYQGNITIFTVGISFL